MEEESSSESEEELNFSVAKAALEKMGLSKLNISEEKNPNCSSKKPQLPYMDFQQSLEKSESSHYSTSVNFNSKPAVVKKVNFDLSPKIIPHPKE